MGLTITFELDGMVLLHVNKSIATGYLLDCDNHHPVLVVPDGNFVSSDLPPLAPPPFTLEPWNKATHHYLDLADTTCAIGKGAVGYYHTPFKDSSLFPTNKRGWLDLRWVVDLRYLTELQTFPGPPKPSNDPNDPKPQIATVTFGSAWIMGREPRVEAMELARWNTKTASGKKLKPWFSDGINLEVDLDAADDKATLPFKKKGADCNVVVRKSPKTDATSNRIAISNICMADRRPMADVELYYKFLKQKGLEVPYQDKDDEPVVMSADQTRCPPAMFLEY